MVKRLEELGIGRPSTYASIITTIQDRGYVWKKGASLVPTFIAIATVRLLERHFGNLVDYGFTARMEEDLDEIAGGDREMVPYLARFYFGNGHSGLLDTVAEALDKADARDINTIPFDGGDGLELRTGKYGPYLQRGEQRASVPDDMAPDELTLEVAEELLAAPSGDRELGTDPKSGRLVLARTGRYGPYVQLALEEDETGKPRSASLFKSMALDTITLEEALTLLSLPRSVGEDPDSNEEIQALNGRYGPYLKKGKDSRSLESEEQLFTVTLEDALHLFSQPKQGRGQTASAPLRELGIDPDTGCAVVVKDGRFGPYVTDGAANASLRKEDSVERIDIERAVDLLRQRRAKLEAQGKKVKPCKKAEEKE